MRRGDPYLPAGCTDADIDAHFGSGPDPDEEDQTMKITNDQGRTFLVRVVKQGGRYGLDDCLVHGEADPLIEFYDFTYANKVGFGARGQFVSRYYASTLAEDVDDLRKCGLCLDGGNADVWNVDGAALGSVLDLAEDLAP